jgi:DNA repair protein RecN (Recombination protein N)
MLTALSIRDIVLVDALDLEVHGGLTVLTGETGAGKSIILDALGLALGARADAGLVRAGAKQASATAVFTAPDDPALIALASERVTIPHAAAVESLNVALAAAPLLLERWRQRLGG